VNDRIDQIEFRIAFLEQANSQLSDTVFQQQQDLKALRAQLAALLQRLEAEQSQPTTWTAQDEKPPHY
jgi:SlyX protein